MARADRSSSTSAGSRWRPGWLQAGPPHKPTDEPVYHLSMIMSDRRRLSRMLKRQDRAFARSCEVEGERRHCAGWFLTLGGIRSAERALGQGPKAALYVCPAVIDSQIFSRTGLLSRRCLTSSSLRQKPPSGPALPGPAGSICFCLACRPRRCLKEGRSRLFDDRNGLCPCRNRQSRVRPSTVFRSARSALDQALAANREREASNTCDDDFPVGMQRPAAHKVIVRTIS